MIMRTFMLQENDLAFDTDRNICFVQGDDEIAQALERLFTTDAGEWFLSANHGLEYPRIRGKGVSNENIQMAIIRAAFQEARVREVVEINIDKDPINRTVNISFLCMIDTGATITVPFSFE